MIPKNLDNLTKAELIKLCKTNNIIGYKSIYNKNKIIDLIKKHSIVEINNTNVSNNQGLDEDNKKEKENDNDTNINVNAIISSKLQTKDWRKTRVWYKNGKSNECENYQKRQLKQLLGYELTKTDERFNMETNEIINKKNPMKNINCFDITEDFDGKVKYNDNLIYFNLKFCCDEGGAQTRTLREVYHFIKCQIAYIKKCIGQESRIIPYFVNILDGDTCYKYIDKIKYSLEKEKQKDTTIYKEIIKRVFIGDMDEFSKNLDLITLISVV